MGDTATILESIIPGGSLAPEPICFGPDQFAKTGITYRPQTIGNGHIKLYPRDFIVEEIGLDGSLASIDTPASLEPAETGFAASMTTDVKAILVKQGIATPAALNTVASKLNKQVAALGYAGLKDSQAITAQTITIPSVSRASLAAFSAPNLRLHSIAPASPRSIEIGKLAGNRFTILVRTDGPPSANFTPRLQEIATHGFPNFFSLQRFTGRLNGTSIGRNLFLGNFHDVVHEWIFGQSPHEPLGLSTIRQRAATQLPDWKKVQETFLPYPNLFTEELKMLAVLAQQEDYLGALNAVSPSARLMSNSYISFCFNRLLSNSLAGGNVPANLPLLHPETRDLYANALPDEPVAKLAWQQPGLKAIGMPARNDLPTMVSPIIHSFLPTEVGTIFHFDLTKGAYATGFLSELYVLHQGDPVPTWVNPLKIETREPFGYPSVSITEAILSGDQRY